MARGGIAGIAMRLARGAAAGAAAGVVWWLVEVAANWALGGVLTRASALDILALDVAVGAAGGAIVGLLSGAASAPALALALTVVYGFLRIFEPPGLMAEATFLVLASITAFLAARLLRARLGILAFVHLTLVATVATVLGKASITESQSYFSHTEPNALTLTLLLVGLPLLGVGLDWLLGLVIRRHGLRLGLELAAAGLAALVWGKPQSTAPLDIPVTRIPASAGAPDVILVSFDTTRADHLSTYGYPRETSPHLTALARDGLNFTQARSPAEWTVPGHASMLTGMYPSRHGAHYAGEWNAGPKIYGRRRVFPLAEDKVTLAEILRDRGYRTGAFVANFANLYRGFGMAQGFARYDDAPGVMPRPIPHVIRFMQRFDPRYYKRPFRSAQDINAHALAWLDGGDTKRPVFLFLNYLEAHHWMMPEAPYDRWCRELADADRLARKGLFTHAMPSRLSDHERTFVEATYDGQIAVMDAAFGELIAALKARGRYDNALIIATADHGELLGEHDQMGHGGRMMYEGLLHIPLVVKFPSMARPRGEVREPVQLVDILPTVASTLGAPLPAGVQGEALPHVQHEIIAEEHINPEFVAHYGEVYDRAMRVLYDPPYKLITTSKGDKLLFDLARDPKENDNLVSRDPARVAELERRLDATMSTMASAGEPRDLAAAPPVPDPTAE
jgi:arylsulfatase A-like enzyme